MRACDSRGVLIDRAAKSTSAVLTLSHPATSTDCSELERAPRDALDEPCDEPDSEGGHDMSMLLMASSGSPTPWPKRIGTFER